MLLIDEERFGSFYVRPKSNIFPCISFTVKKMFLVIIIYRKRCKQEKLAA